MFKLIGIGDNVVDIYLHLGLMFPGGNALNVTVFIAKEDGLAAYIGHFGSDKAGKHVKAVLKMLGVDTSHSLVKDGPNAYSSVNIIDGERVFIEGGSDATISNGIVLTMNDLEYINSFDVIHTSIYSNIENLLPSLMQTGVPISYDFSEIGCRDYFEKIYPYVTFAFFSAGNMNREDVIKFIENVSKQGPKYVLATRGSQGAMLIYEETIYEQPIIPTKVVDTMGAGDSFIAGFLKAIFEGKEVMNALHSGAVKAAETCTVQGTFGFGINIK